MHNSVGQSTPLQSFDANKDLDQKLVHMQLKESKTVIYNESKKYNKLGVSFKKPKVFYEPVPLNMVYLKNYDEEMKVFSLGKKPDEISDFNLNFIKAQRKSILLK